LFTKTAIYIDGSKEKMYSYIYKSSMKLIIEKRKLELSRHVSLSEKIGTIIAL